MIRIAPSPFDPEFELAAFRRDVAGAGALASFTGLVRGPCDALTLEAHPTLTEKMIAAFAERTRARFGLAGLLVVHRIGRMTPGEPIVLAAAAAAHRKEALAAVECVMDWLKSEAPFWKQEERAGARRWIEPSAQDYAAAAMWRETEK